MKFGHFDDVKKEYVISNPRTSGDANHAPIFFSKPFLSFACCV